MTERLEKLLLAAWALIFLYALALPASAQIASEARVFSAAVAEFDAGIFPLSEKEMGDFIRKFPESAHVPEAILYQARAAIEQQKFKLAVDLLSTNAPLAGQLGDQYRYWLGDAYLESTNYQTASATFASLIKDFTNSTRLLAASYNQALAGFKLQEWSRAIELLSQPDGTFRKEALLRPADEFAMRGGLLLAEALLAQKEYRAAEDALRRLAEGDLIPDLKWHRQYLLCRIQLAQQRLPEALESTTNLMILGAATGRRNLLAESVAMQGGILEQLDDLPAAVLAYEKNLAEGVPADRTRQAVLKISELTLAQGKPAEAAQKLEAFLAKRPDDASSDVVLLTSGELHLKLHFAGLQTNRSEVMTNGALLVTNHLQQALLDFDRVITDYPQSSLVGEALLDKGWALWADGRLPPSQAAFRLATERLPHSEEQAVARFKLGEAQFFLKDYTNALLSFRSVLGEFSDLPRVAEALFDKALYQIVRASLEVGDLASADEAMRKILRSYPKSFFSDRTMLLVGQYLSVRKKPSDARQVFQELVERFPESPLAPEIQLAIARSYVQEKDWPAAIVKYEGWLERFATNDLRPQVEFDRAWATDQVGGGTNALALFTNFVARFPSHPMAPRAQYRVASIYYEQKDFVSAEANLQKPILSQNTNYSYQALMLAGRAASARQSHTDAASYFQTLIDNNSCPPDEKAEAYFALGDTLTLEAREPGKPLEKRFAEAIEVFNKIHLLFPTNRLVARAWGRIGDCYFQLAAGDSKQYENATNEYRKAMTMEADVSARSQAEYKLATALEAMASLKPTPVNAVPLLEEALAHYGSVVFEKNLGDEETADPFWLKEAGLAAGKLVEERKQWEIAIKIYNQLLIKLPPLRDLLQMRIKRASEQLRLEKD